VVADDEDFMRVVQGTVSPERSYMRGALNFKGDMTKAVKLRTILALAQGPVKSRI
jgi:putative sterol carrier protein